MLRSRVWTQDEVTMLSTMTNEEIAKVTGRSANAVMVKRAKLYPLTHPKPWTTREIQMVVNKSMRDKELAKILNRSAAAIRQRRSIEKKKRGRETAYDTSKKCY